MLGLVKDSLRVTTNAYDTDLIMLIAAAKQDLGIAGVILPADLDAVSKEAIVTFCKLRFGNPDNADFLKKSYDEQKAQLSMADGYTVWSA